MDVDCTVVALKRSSSAPIINEIPASMSIASPSTSAPRETQSGFNVFSSATPRSRRLSASGSCTLRGLTPRVTQLRQEECLDVAGREAAHEKEIHSAMQISQSWEDLTIEAEGLSFKDTEPPGTLRFKIERQIAKRVLDPLAINLSVGTASTYSSQSPTRTGLGLGQRQCYSPGIHSATWKNSLSPSPTRKAFATRRSLSPIAIRPSCLGSVKRKFELEENNAEQRLQPPAKKPSGLLTATAFTRLDRPASSPYPPGTLSSAGTPESVSSLDSGFIFRPVDSPSSELSSEPSTESAESRKLPERLNNAELPGIEAGDQGTETIERIDTTGSSEGQDQISTVGDTNS